MNWLMRSRAAKAALIPLMLAACGATCGNQPHSPLDINHALAQADVQASVELARVNEIVTAFAHKNGFAVQDDVHAGVGNTELSMILYRDDISVWVSKLRGDPINVSANPLCICELGVRLGLQQAADAAVTELTDDLSRR
jgi:hypothetical protein